MWPFRRRRSRGRPALWDPVEHRERLAAADRALATARREAVAIRLTPSPLHCWLNLQLRQIPLREWAPTPAVYLVTDRVQYSTFSVDSYRVVSKGPAGTGNPIHDEALRAARGF